MPEAGMYLGARRVAMLVTPSPPLTYTSTTDVRNVLGAPFMPAAITAALLVHKKIKQVCTAHSRIENSRSSARYSLAQPCSARGRAAFA
jgi:hypothetical protein